MHDRHCGRLIARTGESVSVCEQTLPSVRPGKRGASPAEEMLRAPLRVLVVDDSDTTRRILRVLLGSRDWTICGEAENGWEGVEKFDELKPDVVVLDLAMPDMDGIEAATMMSASDPSVPIILFTVLGIEGIERSAKEAGIWAIVSKDNAWNLIPQIENLTQFAWIGRPTPKRFQRFT